MRLIPTGRMIGSGSARVFRGLREGDQRGLLLGAAMVAFGWWRKSSAPQRELLVRREVPVGSSVVVRYRRGDQPRLEITEPDVT